MPKRTYADLDAWKRSMDLVCECYRVSRLLPASERFGITAQLCKAAVSVPSNIAEGSGRAGRGELLNFLSIARGSVKEVETLLEIIARLEFLTREKLAAAVALCGDVSRLLFGLRRALQR